VNQLLTYEDLSEWLRVPVATLRDWRANHTGPRALKIGGQIRLRRADVEEWIESRVDA
jgi:excisionase family DNA binding protein